LAKDTCLDTCGVCSPAPPSVSPTTQSPTDAPTPGLCEDDDNADFYWRDKSNGEPIFKDCEWLREKGSTTVNTICAMVAPTDKVLAKDTCLDTCGFCSP